jgi:2-polyprenyl-3-methyl-5-hydroxy-6-metoxy-1,4-benzoquinol methylase
MDTMVAMMLARTIVVSVKLGIFGALASGLRSTKEIATRCGTNLFATQKLLRALLGAGYVTQNEDGFNLAKVAERWLLKDRPKSHRYAVLHRLLDAHIIDHYEDFVYTGKPVQMHERLTPEGWAVYQGGQRSHATLLAEEVVRRTPVPRGAEAMLDIGGGHGSYGAAFCRRHTALRATVIDLPDAIQFGSRLMAREDVGHRVQFRTGDASKDNFGSEAFDVVLLANVVHHFGADQNARIVGRASRAMRPRGICLILDLVRPSSSDTRQVESLLDFYFAVSSGAGIWTVEEMADWQREAGLAVLPPRKVLSMPDYALQMATKDA